MSQKQRKEHVIFIAKTQNVPKQTKKPVSVIAKSHTCPTTKNGTFSFHGKITKRPKTTPPVPPAFQTTHAPKRSIQSPQVRASEFHVLFIAKPQISKHKERNMSLSWQNHKITKSQMSQNKEKECVIFIATYPPPPLLQLSRRPVPPRAYPVSPGLCVPFLSHFDWVSALSHLDNFSSNLEYFSTRALSVEQSKINIYIYIYPWYPHLHKTQITSPCDKPWNRAIRFTLKLPRCNPPPPTNACLYNQRGLVIFFVFPPVIFLMRNEHTTPNQTQEYFPC